MDSGTLTADAETLPDFDPDAPPAPPTATHVEEDDAPVELTVATKDLRDAVSALLSVTGRHVVGGVPLAGVRLGVRERSVTLGATNLRTTHTIPLATTATRSGVLLVPAGLLASVLKGVRAETVKLVETDAGVTIETGRATYTLYQLAKRAYPRLPSASREGEISLPGATLMRIAEAVLPSAARDDAYPALTQVRIETVRSADGQMVVQAQATDSYRAAIFATPLECDDAEEFDVLVPASALERAATTAARTGGEARLSIGEHNVAIRLDAETIIAQRPAAGFPDLAKLITDRDKLPDAARVEVSVADLLAVVRRAGTVASGRSGQPVRLAFTAGKLTVSAAQAGVASMTETMPVAHDGPQIEVGVAGAFMVEALRFAALSDPDVTVRVHTPTHALLLDSPQARHLLMPIRLS